MATQNKMIKASNRYLNSYDAIYNAVSKKPLFNQEDWTYAANNGTLDVYSNALLNSDNINLNDYQEKYNLEFADSQTRTAALYNEVGANRENTDTKRKKTITDQNGNAVEEEYLASDYQYNLELIRRQNDYYQEVRNEEVIADMKSSVSVGEHILSTGIGIFTGLSQGFLEGLNGLIGLSTAVMDAMTQSDYVTTDTIAESFAKVQEGPVPNMIQDIVNFESNYTTLRNDDGSYTTLGKYVGGIFTSLGQMIPSMAIGYGASGVASGAGLAGAGKIGSAASQASFYGGMASNNIQDSYAQYIQNGADIDSAAILANAGIKSTLQWAIERGLGKLLGSTSLDSMVFGRAQSGITSKTLTAAGLENIFKDFLQEGLEEVFQDTSDFLVDAAFEMFIKEYKGTSEISWQSLLDAFIIGGFMSFAGSATKILSTRNIYAGDTKLNKIASWQYGLNMKTLSNTMSTIEKITNRNDVTLSKKDQRIVRAATLECYAAYRTVTSIYNEIGEKRFKDANDILDKITEKIRAGAFDKKTVDEYVVGIKNQLKGLSEASIKKIAKEMQEAGVTEIKAVINADTEKTDAESVKAKEVAKVLGVEKVAITDGDLFLNADGVCYISGNKISKTVGELLQSKAIKNLIDSILKEFAGSRILSKFDDDFRNYYNRNVSDREVIYALLYDKDFFDAVLLNSNKDAYKLLSYFVNLSENLKPTLENKIQKVAMAKIINNWINSFTEYCIVHPEADPSLFLYVIKDKDKQSSLERKIVRERWGMTVYNKVVLNGGKSLNKTDSEVLHKRFESVFSKETAERHWQNILSDNIKSRQSSMNALANKYKSIFYRGYDGTVYLEDTSMGNKAFNRFLQRMNLDLYTFLSEDALTKSDIAVITNEYGEINTNSILRLRQMQFNSLYSGYHIVLNKSGAIEITQNGKIVGFSEYKKLQREVENGHHAASFVTSTYSRSKEISDLVNEELRSQYFTIDDLIVNPEILRDDIQNKIIEYAKTRYSVEIQKPNDQFTFLFFRDYFLNQTNGSISVTMNYNGDFVLTSVEKLLNIFNNKDVIINENSTLEEIFKSEYIPQDLKLVFDDSNTARYVPYKSTLVNGSYATVFDHTVYIGKKLLKESPEYVRFAVAHELQHAYMFVNNVNLGMDYRWLDKVESKQRQEIIKDVRKHASHLFKNVPKDSALEAEIVNDYVYHASGESQAYGTEGSEIVDFLPVLSQNDKNVLKITLPWGKTYTIRNIEKADVISSIWKKTADNLYTFDEWEDLYHDVKIDSRIDDWRIKKDSHKYSQNESNVMDIIKNELHSKKIQDLLDYFDHVSLNSAGFNLWKRLPMNTTKVESEHIKATLKEDITLEDSVKSKELMHALLCPDIPFDQFLNTAIPFVRMQKRGHLGDSPFVSIYAGATKDSVKFVLEGFYKMSSHPDDALDTYIIVGTFKPKDILVYFGGFESEVLIEPSKLVSSKIYKSQNNLTYYSDPHNYVTFVTTADGRIVVMPEYFRGHDGTYMMDGTTGQLFDLSEFSDPTVYTTEYRLGVDDDAWTYEILSERQKSGFKYEHAKAKDHYGDIHENVLKVGNSLRFVEFKDVLSKDSFRTIGLPFYKIPAEIDVRFTSNEGRVITVDETSTSLVDLESEYGMSLAPKSTDKIRPPRKNEVAEDDPRAKNFIKKEQSAHPTYSVRYLVVDDKGNQVLDSKGKPVYSYVYPDEKTKTRKVAQNKWKGTKLEAFTKRYNVTQMSKELQTFILNAEGLDPILQSKIDGKLKGTLTEQDVKDYLRSKDNIDDRTFKAINDAFYKNEYVDTFDELQGLIGHAREAWTLWRIPKRYEPLSDYKEVLEDREMTVDLFKDIVLNFVPTDSEKETGAEKYFKLEKDYDIVETRSGTKDLKIQPHYMRIALMKHYDGSIKSLRDAASAARMAVSQDYYNLTQQDSRLNETVYDAYEDALESIDDMSEEDMKEALAQRKLAQLASELSEKYSDKIPQTARTEMMTEYFQYKNSIDDLSKSELTRLFNGVEGRKKATLEGYVADITGKYYAIDVEAKPKAGTYVNRIKGAVNTMKGRLDEKQRKSLIGKYPDLFTPNFEVKKELYQNTLKSKSRPTEYVRYKSIEEVKELFEKISDIKDEVLLGSRSMARELKSKQKETRELKRTIRKLEKGVKSDGKTPHVVEIITDNGSASLPVEKEIPLMLMKLLQVHYNKNVKTNVKNLSEANEYHKKRIANNFYENADKILVNLTQKDVDEIIDFFVNGIVNLNDATAPYQVAELLIMAYLIEIGRKGNFKAHAKSGNGNILPVNFVISADQLSKLEDLLKKRISRSATVLASWKDVLHKLDPVKTIQQSIARRAGVKATDKEIETLLTAIESGDMDKIAKAKAIVSTRLCNRAMKKRASVKGFDAFLDKLLQWERLAMLSGPGTWVRNVTSDVLIDGVHWTADKVMPGLDKILYKMFPKSQEVKGQYKIAGTKVDDNVAKYIESRLKKGGLLDEAISGISKYDPRKSLRGVGDASVLTEMLTNSIVSVANSNSLFTGKVWGNAEKWIKKAISDDPWVKKATYKYLGKIITEDLEVSEKAKAANVSIRQYNKQVRTSFKDIDKKVWRDKLKKLEKVPIKSAETFLSEDHLDKQFLVYVAEAYKMACYDYMHRSNPLLDFESKLAHKSHKAYFLYKQVFPFAGVGWNWFVEGLNYTPVGLVKSIINFAKLENTVEKFEEARRTQKYGDIGPSSKFASYIVKRNITKGVIGSIGFVIGTLLIASGIARLDEEDDKYKIIVGNVGVDVSDLFSTQGIFLGMALAGSFKNGDAFDDVCIAALDQLFMDSTFSDVFNTFRYNETFGEFLMYQTYALPNMLVPNFLKTVIKISTVYEVQYSDGFLRNVERFAAKNLPGLAYFMPHYYDPYTGEKQIPNKAWYWEVGVNAVDQLSPLGLSVYNVSELERNAIAHGINKKPLTGKYTINDESIKLSSKDVESLNMYYGKLNVSSFKEIQSNREVFKIQQSNGTYKTVRWSQMTDKEKAAIIDRTMTNNSGYAKIYILTSSGKYRYYASDAEYKELRSLGITKNVYRATGKNKGFVKS